MFLTAVLSTSQEQMEQTMPPICCVRPRDRPDSEEVFQCGLCARQFDRLHDATQHSCSRRLPSVADSATPISLMVTQRLPTAHQQQPMMAARRNVGAPGPEVPFVQDAICKRTVGANTEFVAAQRAGIVCHVRPHLLKCLLCPAETNTIEHMEHHLAGVKHRRKAMRGFNADLANKNVQTQNSSSELGKSSPTAFSVDGSAGGVQEGDSDSAVVSPLLDPQRVMLLHADGSASCLVCKVCSVRALSKNGVHDRRVYCDAPGN